ncbi:uncharacterized protein MONOS_18363 [Monocercomonoides exilis]|uniref:uncharacterized protein n=1 Tax=Monocercomonoides exilis TaxID=2049356 RepID=UPI00355A45D7|nr:hypothetical protein MONOS_18363 [Monocercomonoides exilis]
MRMHLCILACLILGKTFEAQHVSGAATLENKGNSNDAQYLSEAEYNYLFEQNSLSGSENTAVRSFYSEKHIFGISQFYS